MIFQVGGSTEIFDNSASLLLIARMYLFLFVFTIERFMRIQLFCLGLPLFLPHLVVSLDSELFQNGKGLVLNLSLQLCEIFQLLARVRDRPSQRGVWVQRVSPHSPVFSLEKQILLVEAVLGTFF